MLSRNFNRVNSLVGFLMVFASNLSCEASNGSKRFNCKYCLLPHGIVEILYNIKFSMRFLINFMSKVGSRQLKLELREV